MTKFTFLTLLTSVLFYHLSSNAQCPADLTVTNGNTGTWVNNTSQLATVTITAVGAGGGKNTGTGCLNPTTAQLGGSGASMTGTFQVAPGESIFIIAGAPGADQPCSGGGGGASGAVNCGNPANCGGGNILLIAGGGAGTSGYGSGPGGDVTNGNMLGGIALIPGGAAGGGLNSNGGSSGGAIGGGAVLKTAIALGGNGFNTGGIGGNGMGAGGGGYGGYAGGGGGYSGGNGETDLATASGGYSFNSGTSQLNNSGITGGGANAGSVTVQCVSLALPVNLSYFMGHNSNYQNVLSWQTATEVNNAFFEVQRSEDGKNFIPIGQVTGQGNSNMSIDYRFIDDKFVSNINYYRLKQYDIDYKFEYSSIIRINSANNNSISLSPNPSKETAYLNVSNEFLNTTAELFNIKGQKIISLDIIKNGQAIPVSKLEQGIYFLKCKGGVVIKLVKE